MTRSGGAEWQLVLADLALILFLVTVSALATMDEAGSDLGLAGSPALSSAEADRFSVAPSQEVFRPTPLGPTLGEWLARRQRDPRVTLTVFAQYTLDERSEVWEAAQALANDASASGFAVRVVITPGEASDLHASLAYDVAP